MELTDLYRSRFWRATAKSDDVDLVNRVLDSDREAFREIYDRYRGPVLRRIRCLLAPGADEEDVIQEIFLQVYRSLHRFDTGRPLKPWLMRIAHNVTLTCQRSRRTIDFEDLRRLSTPRPEWARLTARERVRTLYALIQELPEVQREALLLHTVEGMTLAQVANTVGAPLNTIVTRVRRARLKLVSRMDQVDQVAQRGKG